ncbi:hypothetical protein D3C76_855410 [compost metagenome]
MSAWSVAWPEASTAITWAISRFMPYWYGEAVWAKAPTLLPKVRVAMAIALMKVMIMLR